MVIQILSRVEMGVLIILDDPFEFESGDIFEKRH